MKKARIRASAPKKIKVTKRTAAKIPWYERPVLLFGAIAVVLILGGILMSHLYRRSTSPTSALTAAGDSVAVATAPAGTAAEGGAEADRPHPDRAGPTTPDSAADTASADVAAAAASGVVAGRPGSQSSPDDVSYPHILFVGAALPPPQPGDVLPPLRVETLAEVPAARDAYRAARGLAVPGGAGPVYGFAEARAVARAITGASAAAAEAGDAESAAQPSDSAPLEFSDAQRNWLDFEVQRDAAGQLYLLGFVPPTIAEQIGALGPELPLPPAVAHREPPKWQFWKKRESGPPVVRAGATVTLYPDLSPESTCAIVLPWNRIAGAAAREIVGGMTRRTVVLDVTLR